MDIFSAHNMRLFVLNQEKFVKIGVVEMAFAPGEFATVLPDILERIAVTWSVHQANIGMKVHLNAWHNAHKEHTKINIQTLVSIAKVAKTVEINQIYAQDAYQPLLILCIFINLILVVWKNALQIPIMQEIFVLIVMLIQLFAELVKSLQRIVHHALALTEGRFIFFKTLIMDHV